MYVNVNNNNNMIPLFLCNILDLNDFNTNKISSNLIIDSNNENDNYN